MKTRLDDLNLDGLKLYQYPEGYNFTSDSVLLANFVKTKHSDICVEIGSGSGIISILVNYKTKPKKIFAFEIQKKYANLCEKNVEFNNMQNVIQTINDDIKNYNKYINKQVDIVFCNPPYFANVQKSESEEIAICKHESYLPLKQLLEITSKMLKFGGKFFIVYPATRIAELMYELINVSLQPKKIFFAQPNANKNANTVFVECIKNGKNGTIVMPTLITNNLNGDYISTIQKLYRDKED